MKLIKKALQEIKEFPEKFDDKQNLKIN